MKGGRLLQNLGWGVCCVGGRLGPPAPGLVIMLCGIMRWQGGHGPDGGNPFRPQISVQPLTHDVMVEHDSQAQRRAGDFKVDQPGGQSADTRPLSAALDHVGDHGVARATMRSSMELHALRPPPACTACATGGAR